MGLMGLLPAVAGSGVLAVDAVAYAPSALVDEQRVVTVPGLPRELDWLRVGLLSDFHVGGANLDQAREAVLHMNRLRPDLVCLAGDLVDDDPAWCGPLAEVLCKLEARYGVAAVPGNHDYVSTAVAPLGAELAARGASLLVNSARRVAGKLWLAGLDDPCAGQPDLDAALAKVPKHACTLLLCHAPDYADSIAGHPALIPLQLSGHSHGGQVVLPLVGPPTLPHLGRKYHTGLYHVEGTERQVYTTRGVGHSVPLRINCPPEVTLLVLRSA
jgi:predicted MPP superfamily phosphohydrolase